MQLQWVKSSYSTDADGTNCVELAADRGSVLIRESEDPDVVVRTTPRLLRAVLEEVRAGRFGGRA